MRNVDEEVLTNMSDSDLRQFAKKCADEIVKFVPEKKEEQKKETPVTPAQNSSKKEQSNDLDFTIGTPLNVQQRF